MSGRGTCFFLRVQFAIAIFAMASRNVSGRFVRFESFELGGIAFALIQILQR